MGCETARLGARRSRSARLLLPCAGLVVVSLLAPSSPTPASATPSGGRDDRFERVVLPSDTRISGHFDDTGLPSDASIRVIVVLEGDSVATAARRAARVGARFDRAATARAVSAQQEQTVAGLRSTTIAVERRFTEAVNAVTATVRVGDLGTLAATPGVAAVHPIRYHQRTNAAADEYTGVPTVWERFTPPWGDTTGDGMVIGIIDDGIDYHHADFGGSGDPADYLADDPTIIETVPTVSFPTAKVVGGYDFSGDQYDANAETAIPCASLAPGQLTSIPCPDPDPLACGVHGTHVAGTAAGQGVLADGSTFTGPYTSTTFADHTFLVAPGSAPQASIRAYKVFGCDGSVGDDVLLDAIDQAIDDGVDVLNLSLGSSFGVPDGPLELALDGASALGVMVVVSAGNSGTGAYLVGGPSTADSVLSVAAADASEPILPRVLVQVAGATSVDGQNSNDHVFTSPVIGQALFVGLGCEAADFVGVAGKIAIAERGTCDRTLKAELGQSQGALAVVMINDSFGYPPVEGPIPGVSIPFVGARPEAGFAIANGDVLTLSDGGSMTNPGYGGFASFTSDGPRADNSLKPDVTAPGVNIVSAGVGSGTESLTLSGTSMAAPHVAGIAALVRQTHPGWTPTQVKGALMATASPMTDLELGRVDVVRGGAGMVDAPNAADSVVTVTTSDGTNNLSFGLRELTGAFESTLQVHVRNESAAAITYDLTAVFAEAIDGVTMSFSADPVTVAPSATTTVSVTISVDDPSVLPSAELSHNGELWTIQGYVRATPQGAPVAGVHQLSVPFLLVAQGLSDVLTTGATTMPVRTESGPFTPDSLRITNDGPHEGVYDLYQWALSDDPADASDETVPDIASVGVQLYGGTEGETVVFAINTTNRLATQSMSEYDIWIDVGQDGTYEYVIVVIDGGLALEGDFDGTMLALLLDGNTFSYISSFVAFAPANSSIVEAPVLWADLGSADFAFDVSSFSLATGGSDFSDTAAFDPGDPAVTNGAYATIPAGTLVSIPAAYDRAAAIAQSALGWMVVTVDNASGTSEANTVPIMVPPAIRP